MNALTSTLSFHHGWSRASRSACLFSLAIACLTAATSFAIAGEHQTIDVGQRPESVTKGFDDLYYVTLMMGNETPGDAVIKVLDGDEVRTFATGFDEPKGIAFTGDYLITTDIKKVWKIDSGGKATVLANESDFPTSINYLNDAAVSRNGRRIFISDMGANTKMFGPDGLWSLDSAEAKELPVIGRIFELNINGKVRVAVEPSPLMPNPNGVTTSGRNRLLIAGFFTGNVLEARNGKLKVLTSGYRGGDAIEQDADGNIYLSSWTQGKVWRLDKKGENPVVLLEGLKSAADFYLDRKERKLLVPDMLAGTVTVLSLEK